MTEHAFTYVVLTIHGMLKIDGKGKDPVTKKTFYQGSYPELLALNKPWKGKIVFLCGHEYFVIKGSREYTDDGLLTLRLSVIEIG